MNASPRAGSVGRLDPQLRLRDGQESCRNRQPTLTIRARAVAYDYDTHGSMSNLSSAPDRFDLRWDWNDMIHTIDLGGGGRAWYQYGADKQRCRKRIDRQNGTSGYWERIYLPGFEPTGDPAARGLARSSS